MRYAVFRRASAGLLAMAAALCQPAAAQPSFDIVGLRPGMSEAEAMAALTAHRPGMRVQKRNMTYNYSDGVQQLNTPPFLYELWVTFDDAQGREDFRLYFAPPPSASRVLGMTRQVSLKSPPTQAQLGAQLAQRYGSPTTSGKSNTTTNFVWGEPGKPMCWRSTPNTTVIGVGEASDILSGLKRGQDKGYVPRDPSTCGLAAAASMAGEPVHNLTVRLVDYGAWAGTHQKARDWVEQQRQEAVKARLSRGAAPKL
ncbi:hypothetical protein JNX00_05550 [Hydrogenophaga sp. YM1]|jgi:hypothetical protein|uniref:hypothetical protein n=1 Tax=Hydrogenophaga TaxID=47420 RepID=UPI00087882FA|nr:MULTISPECIES: hypothetical protein [unclassified Hydrogenophaga]MBN9373400.1 hypothetical protein [Hydrogenophaga sp.]OJV35989.1 MAG: hypothetical protein BGO22_10990 [Hydrogenophaga sp. 70-12]QRR35337.1 hypothetical protein JNX00_05550 [Hydrogenophaga sp. YM1]